MAGLIARALVAPAGDAAVPSAYGPDPGSGRSYACDGARPVLHFVDVAASDPLCKHVHDLWARGIIDGCSTTMSCGTDVVNRDQTARFVVRAFHLPSPGP